MRILKRNNFFNYNKIDLFYFSLESMKKKEKQKKKWKMN